MFKKFFITNFPFFGKYKRFIVAVYHRHRAVKATYSQHGEDIFIWNFLKQYNLTESYYVDVGANHPTDISNTYLLYRNGLTGIIIEPNSELISLFKKFRKKDIALAIGCSNNNRVLKFNISKTPVMSSFADSRNMDIHKSMYLPVMKLDDALAGFEFNYINLLSIDVEGLNYEVLQGSRETIKKSLVICLEYDDKSELEKFTDFLGSNFECLEIFGCNVIYINTQLRSSIMINESIKLNQK